MSSDDAPINGFSMPTILDLCAGTGAWSEPYRGAGYQVIPVELREGFDVRLWKPVGNVRGVLAAPPCTHLCSSGARWWKAKGPDALLQALSIVDACLRVIVVEDPKWWVLENPVGRLSRFLGPARHTFNPCDYGDPYTKRTCLWGKFVMPVKRPVKATSDWVHKHPPSEERSANRSVTPAGFARAFFEANP